MSEFPAVDVDFASKKAAYFSDFALRHLSMFRIQKKGDIIGKENVEWRNVPEHCLVEAVAADVLAEYLSADRERVVQAALLHDWYKRYEVGAMAEMGAVAGNQYALQQDKEKLRALGISNDVIKLAHANEPSSPDVDTLQDRTLEEKIIHYADLITSGSDFVDFHERLKAASTRKMEKERSEYLRMNYGGKSFFEVQEIAAAMEEDEFKKMLGLGNESLIDFIRENIFERVRRFEPS